MKIKLKKIIILIVIMVCFIPLSTFAAVQVECKPGTSKWLMISLTDAFDVCLNMKSVNSSIGTGNLNPHLTTNKDYNAVALLAVSSYGYGMSNTGLSIKLNNGGKEDSSSSRSYNSTTGNASGVMNLGTTIVYTASLTTDGVTDSSKYRKSLLEAYNSSDKRKYVEIVDSGYTQNAGSNAQPNQSARERNIGMGIAQSEDLRLDSDDKMGERLLDNCWC